MIIGNEEKNLLEIEIGYKLRIETGRENSIFYLSKDFEMRIFGEKFVLNNKDKCKIIYQNRVYELKSDLKDIDEKLEPDNEYSLKLIIPSHI